MKKDKTIEEEVKMPDFLLDVEDNFDFNIDPNPESEDTEEQDENVDDIEKLRKINEEKKAKKQKKSKKESKVKEEETELETEDETELELETEQEEESEDDNSGESSPEDIIKSLTSAYLEHSGLDLEDGLDSITSPEDFFSLIDTVIEENSKPTFASTDVERLNEYVKNGGDISKYFEKISSIGEYNVELESDQRRAVEDLLKRQGIPSAKIAKRIEKMIDRGDLEDEAIDAIEILEEYKEKDRVKLEKEQEEANRQRVAQQKALIDDITKTINTLDNIGGVPVSTKDKKTLMEYMLKPTSTGRTKWVEDQSKSVLPFIASAFFQMNGEKLIKGAIQKGQKSALDQFKSKLKSNVQARSTGSPQRTKKDKPFWE